MPPRQKARATTKSAAPTEDQLAKTLSTAHTFWNGFIDKVTTAHPATKMEWKYYKSDSTWRYILRLRQRNLAYLRPSPGSFLVSLALSENSIHAAEKLGVSKSLLDQVRASPLFPEGRAVRIVVTTAADMKSALLLTDAKAANL